MSIFLDIGWWLARAIIVSWNSYGWCLQRAVIIPWKNPDVAGYELQLQVEGCSCEGGDKARSESSAEAALTWGRCSCSRSVTALRLSGSSVSALLFRSVFSWFAYIATFNQAYTTWLVGGWVDSLKCLSVDSLSSEFSKMLKLSWCLYACAWRDWNGKRKLKAWKWNFGNATKLNLDWQSSWGRKLLNPVL